VTRKETLVQHDICIGVTSRRMKTCLQHREKGSLQSLRVGHCDNFHESRGRRLIMSVLFNHVLLPTQEGSKDMHGGGGREG
jgi:hypothetical protein